MKGKLEFNLENPPERKEFKRATNATNAYLCLWDIAQEIFRPARKHGYTTGYVEDALLNKLKESSEVREAIDALETKFYRILEDHGVSLEDLE